VRELIGIAIDLFELDPSALASEASVLLEEMGDSHYLGAVLYAGTPPPLDEGRFRGLIPRLETWCDEEDNLARAVRRALGAQLRRARGDEGGLGGDAPSTGGSTAPTPVGGGS
jgi:hypothetical protein